ncbi:MAG: DUF4115 domain-containing protein, partial [Actinomycetota bacterium]|nr:DUF4115 domain-containing protein [Actinomycetota bacterium]
RTGSATGPATFTGTLHAGDRHLVPVGQVVWVRIGNPPGISLDVNGMPLPFTAPVASQPFNLVFEPAA